MGTGAFSANNCKFSVRDIFVQAHAQPRRRPYRIKLKESFLVPGDFEPSLDSIGVGIYFAGDRDRGDHIARYVPERARGLQVGETLLLFLKADLDQVWRLATSNGNSIVAIKGNAVAPQAASPLAMGLAQKSWVVLRRELLETVKKKVGHLEFRPAAAPS